MSGAAAGAGQGAMAGSAFGPWGAAIGAGIGLVKSQLVDRKVEEKERELAAQTQELSPWTGLRAGAVERADPVGSAMKYGYGGLQFGQSYGANQSAKAPMQGGEGSGLDAIAGNYSNFGKTQGQPQGQGQSPWKFQKLQTIPNSKEMYS